ncbi:uncharacterized protein LOC132726243 [Ruditapes philippinarum]|uniref:uncharacterized protein LOC132726243 n=1 Tax=Ruditapes philippinarum TaxID=129788 RepID=UPI00295BFAFE|nr:uncharacterized protein LOC132726243 [Ruditapes philippinarum]
MVSVGLCILETIAAIETLLKVSQQYALLLEPNVTNVVTADNEPFDEPRTAPSVSLVSIHHYSRHGLCKSFKGKKKLYKAMKTKLCLTKLSFTAEFVMDLCSQKHGMLEKWVAALFDIDGDGYITHFEKQLYDND